MDFHQNTNRILMIRPAAFGFNMQTAASNPFQKNDDFLSAAEISEHAKAEFDHVVESLLACEVDVFIVDDTSDPLKSDAVFPNNWISFHQSGTIITYPMMSPSRRREIREDILDDLAVHFNVKEVWRFQTETEAGDYLEGTGSLVLDRENRIAYVCRSPRTNPALVDTFCQRMGFQPVLFDSVDGEGVPVYHTNVIMALTRKLAVICMESIQNDDQRGHVKSWFDKTGKSVVEITLEQVGNFAGNMLQVGRPGQRPLLVMSQSARESLTADQIVQLEDESDLIAVSIPVIEKYGGGSVRCMMAELFLDPR